MVKLAPRYALRTMFLLMSVCAVVFAVLRVWLTPVDEVVLRVEGFEQVHGRMVYLDNIPIGTIPCFIRSSQLARACESWPEKRETLDVYSFSFAALVTPLQNRQGRYPMIWVRAEGHDEYTVATPYGLAGYLQVIGIGPAESCGLPPGVRVEPYGKWMPQIGTKVVQPASSGGCMEIEYSIADPNSVVIRDDTQVLVRFNTNRRPVDNGVTVAIPQTEWALDADGNWKARVVIADVPDGPYWFSGSFFLKQSEYSRRASQPGTRARVTFHEVSNKVADEAAVTGGTARQAVGAGAQ